MFPADGFSSFQSIKDAENSSLILPEFFLMTRDFFLTVYIFFPFARK
jgi:hypothetical protein